MGTKSHPGDRIDTVSVWASGVGLSVGMVCSLIVGYGSKHFWFGNLCFLAFAGTLLITIDRNRLVWVVGFLARKRKRRVSDPQTRLSEFSSSQLNPDEMQAESQVAKDVQARRNKLKAMNADTQQASLSSVDVDVTAAE